MGTMTNCNPTESLVISTFTLLPRIPLLPHFHKRPINLHEVRNARYQWDQDHLCRISRHAHSIDFKGPQVPPRIQACLHLEEKRFGVLTVPRKNKDVRLDRIKNEYEKQPYLVRQITCPSPTICAVVASQIPKDDFQALELREFLR